MLRALFFLIFVGGAIYAGLVASHSALTRDDGSFVLAINHPASQLDASPLRSWGTSLQSLRRESRAAPQTQPAVDSDKRPVSEAHALAASYSRASADDPIGWVKVALAARAHGEASVSSPISHFYRAGSELQVIERRGPWLEVRDPATQERGWVYETYLAMIERPSGTQVAAAPSAEPAPIDEAAATMEAAAKPKQAKIAKAKKPRSVKPSRPEFAAAFDQRRGLASRAERRGLGLFFFGRRMAKLEAEGRVAAR
jgi:hypothetical protein